jgi:uncharacterized membrane protein
MTATTQTPVRTPQPRPRAGRVVARLGWVLMTLASAYVVVFFIAPYLAFDPSFYFPGQLETYLRLEFVLGVHVLSGILVLATGPFQFVPWIRRRLLPVHRLMGAVYVAGAFALGGSGLVLAPFAYTGVATSLAFALLALAALFTTGRALQMVLVGRIRDHRRWMIRSFSLVFAGVMLRAMTAIYTGLSALGVVSYSFEAAYAGIAWLCWVPNLLIAVWFTRRGRRAGW